MFYYDYNFCSYMFCPFATFSTVGLPRYFMTQAVKNSRFVSSKTINGWFLANEREDRRIRMLPEII